MAELTRRLNALDSGKLLIRNFIKFQYGSLSRACKPHLHVFSCLSRHGLEIDPFTWEVKGLANPTTKGLLTLEEKDQDQDKEKDQEKEGVQGERPRIKDSTVLPESLNASDPFREAWAKWLEHLKQKRKPATLHAQDLQLQECAIWGVERSIRAIEHSIKGGWQGVYEPKHNNRKPSSTLEILPIPEL